MPEIIIAGAGLGSLTPEVREAVSRAEVVCCSSRFLKLIPDGKRVIDLKNFAQAFSGIAQESGQVVILVSGDPGLYSLLPLVKRRFPRENITVLPGISSLQTLCARACESWSDAVILSGHGRSLRAGKFLNLVERNRLVVLFCDKNNSPQWACRKLLPLSGVDVVIGENLGSDSERVLFGRPDDFVNHESPELSLMLIRNNSPFVPENFHPRDSEFLRAPGIVMTNESVRSVILARLSLRKDSILWDIGAGTGSISVSAGLEFPECEIHAVEHKKEAAALIARNAENFHLHNIEIHNGRALEVIAGLPEPSHVFIGGSDGELAGIIEHVRFIHNRVRVVAACVTLETFSKACELLRDFANFEAVQILAASSKPLTPDATMMKANNPVMLLTGDTQ